MHPDIVEIINKLIYKGLMPRLWTVYISMLSDWLVCHISSIGLDAQS